jgi:hypothetical protein
MRLDSALKRSRPQYISAKKISTLFDALESGWAWNCQIIFRFAYHKELAEARIIWNRHGHECSRIWKLSGNFTLIQIPMHQKVSRFFGSKYIGDDFFLGPNLILIFFNLLNLFWHTDKNFCFYAEANFWDFVRNDNSNKKERQLDSMRLDSALKRSRPQYISTQKISTLFDA